MRIAITGGTGFVGRHLADRLETGAREVADAGAEADPTGDPDARDHDRDRVVVISRRTGVDIDDVEALSAAFAGCDAVAHCAGINREIGSQTFDRVHVRGTVMVAALHGALTDRTVAVVGGEELTLSEAVRRVGSRVGRHPLVLRWPLWATRAVARLSEWTMTVPLLAVAQQRMLAEGVSEASPPTDPLPDELTPRAPFDSRRIDAALPPRGPFTLRDLRIARRLGR